MEEVQAVVPVAPSPVTVTTITHSAVTLANGWEAILSTGTDENGAYTVLRVTDNVGDDELYLEVTPQDLLKLGSLFTTATPMEGTK